MTLIEIYTRAVPFPDVDTFSVGHEIATGQLKPEEHLPDNVDPHILPVLKTCFAQLPKDRPDFKMIIKQIG